MEITRLKGRTLPPWQPSVKSPTMLGYSLLRPRTLPRHTLLGNLRPVRQAKTSGTWVFYRTLPPWQPLATFDLLATFDITPILTRLV